MKKNFKLIIFLFLSHYSHGQNSNINTITTSVPFLLINPNAQSMGIADIGVVAASEYYESGLTQNPALLSRNEKVIGAKFSYKSWLRHLVPDINMIDANFYYALSKKITLAYSFNSFSYGDISYTNINGNEIGTFKPKELYHNLRYAQSLSPNFSIGLGLKYIVSDLTNGIFINGQPTHSGKAIAADIGLDYRKEIAKKETSFWRYDIGASVVNMCNKINYLDTGDGDFLPMQLALGTIWTYNKDVNTNTRYCIDLAYQCEKLLVPTQPKYSIDANGNRTIIAGKDPYVSVFNGAYQSFYDAPDGASEEFAEIIHKIGIENRFVFNKESSIALRVGHFNENLRKGDRKYFNVGIGGKYKFIYLDAGMILLYKSGNIAGQPVYTLGLQHPYSLNLTIGFKYTFKEHSASDFL
ncbi:MAG: type IX secretion system outer membrane channel protein PorV [Bacteroidota bacterium]